VVPKREELTLKKRHSLDRKEALWAYIFISPPILQFLIFFAVPLGFAVYASFTDWNILNPTQHFIGLDNFKEMLTQEKFWKSFANTGMLVFAVPIYMFISMLVALGYNRRIPLNNAFRVIYYLPFVSSLVALTVMWRWLFNSQFGIVNNFLRSVFNIQGPDWLLDPKWIKPVIMLMIIWKMIGVSSIYYLAALQNIPKTYYEAAVIDGASGIKQFRHITLPMLTPISFYQLVVFSIGTLQTLIEVYMLTEGGLGGRNYSAGTVAFYIFDSGFRHYRMGYACGVSLVFLILVMAITLIQFKLSDKWVFEGN